jgi:hypothetical protein
MLAMEQKRAKRCNTCCMLMLIDAARLLEGKNRRKTFKKLLAAVTAGSRDTDIKGWYDMSRVIGVIFTEFEKRFAGLIVNKMKASIAETFPGDRSSVHISYLLFPEDQKTGVAAPMRKAAESGLHGTNGASKEKNPAYVYTERR